MRACISVTKCCRISTGRFWNEVLPDFCAPLLERSAAGFLCAALERSAAGFFQGECCTFFAAQPSFGQRSAAGFSETDRGTVEQAKGCRDNCVETRRDEHRGSKLQTPRERPERRENAERIIWCQLEEAVIASSLPNVFRA
jgi:hypothetical protein